MADINEDQIIETVTEDGEVVQFRLFDIIEFEEKEYALLLPVEDEDSDEAELVLMRLTKEADDYLFETIDDDEEFDRVSEYIESIDEDEE
ncbi:MAG: DUF1292 domain-containing protein [Candidatus Gastranaerophilaceae bacterium]